MKSITKMNSCTGCRACEQVCPQNCIQFSEDSEGFIYPIVNLEKCIECGLCKRVCHALEMDKTNLLCEEKNRQAWYGWSLDDNLHEKSSSGGAFSEIVAEYLQGEGTVFGAAFEDDFLSVVQKECDATHFESLRKSKYVFSDPKYTYKRVKERLIAGEKVVYCGTPCQIAGLRSYLKGIDQSRLLAIDFICHGVPSPLIYRDHVRWLTKGPIKNVDFRSKRMGAKHCLLVEDSRGEKVYPKSDDMYFGAFLTDSILRKCCYECSYSEGNHTGDITLADFWAVTEYAPAVDHTKGVSLIISNNCKGRTIVERLTSTMNLNPLDEDSYRYVYVSHCGYSKLKREKFFFQRKRYGRNFHEWKMKFSILKRIICK